MKDSRKKVYPVIIKKDKNKYLVYIPDFDKYTQGKDFYDAIYMARDLIGVVGLDMDKLPDESDMKEAIKIAKNKGDDKELGIKISDGIVTYVDIDFEEYRKRLEKKAVRKNISLPSWLNEKAEKEGINFSRLLQEALLDKLG